MPIACSTNVQGTGRHRCSLAVKICTNCSCFPPHLVLTHHPHTFSTVLLLDPSALLTLQLYHASTVLRCQTQYISESPISCTRFVQCHVIRLLQGHCAFPTCRLGECKLPQSASPLRLSVTFCSLHAPPSNTNIDTLNSFAPACHITHALCRLRSQDS